jgi:hypothetical protein
VAKEIRVNKRLDLFAATPPLEAVKILFSLAVTEGIGFIGGRRRFGKQLEFIDVKGHNYRLMRSERCMWNCLRRTRKRVCAEDC